ncbi:hypothetical protein PRZ48_004284 [Zasmidium cellare]|uniref:Uncharacterized protein n=1 Tax=Zasmidium cellare TaxID=395010 RepID=A0ABR0EPR6_ZASCE|nr:hypothetical protein PRZ48_004284 [Zasmidium cellare]
MDNRNRQSEYIKDYGAEALEQQAWEARTLNEADAKLTWPQRGDTYLDRYRLRRTAMESPQASAVTTFRGLHAVNEMLRYMYHLRLSPISSKAFSASSYFDLVDAIYEAFSNGTCANPADIGRKF